MRIIFCITILLLLFACDEDNKDKQNEEIDLELTRDNVFGDWVLVNRIDARMSSNSSHVPFDTINYGHEVNLYENNELDWLGDVYHGLNKEILSGNSNGFWYFQLDSGSVEADILFRMYLNDIFTYDSTDYTEGLDVFGIVTKLTNKELRCENYYYNQQNIPNVAIYKLIRNN